MSTRFLHLILLGTMAFISGQFFPIISIYLLIIFLQIMAYLPLLRFPCRKIPKDKYKNRKCRKCKKINRFLLTEIVFSFSKKYFIDK